MSFQCLNLFTDELLQLSNKSDEKIPWPLGWVFFFFVPGEKKTCIYPYATFKTKPIKNVGCN